MSAYHEWSNVIDWKIFQLINAVWDSLLSEISVVYLFSQESYNFWQPSYVHLAWIYCNCNIFFLHQKPFWYHIIPFLVSDSLQVLKYKYFQDQMNLEKKEKLHTIVKYKIERIFNMAVFHCSQLWPREGSWHLYPVWCWRDIW